MIKKKKKLCRHIIAAADARYRGGVGVGWRGGVIVKSAL